MALPSSSSSSSPLNQSSTFAYLVKRAWQTRWLVLVVSLWLQACAGVGYAFGSYSPLVKSVLGYNQKQISILGIAKDLGASIGLIAGSLSEIIPTWCLVTLGALHNLIGYGWLWLIVTKRCPALPIWAVCILIFIGTNGETYFNTATLVTNVRNFPKSRGHVVGLLKGFSGLCSAIFSQIYTTFYAPNQGSYMAIVALGPTLVAFLVMFVIRPIKSKTRMQETHAEAMGFAFIYGDCIILAAYLMTVLILQDLVSVSQKVSLMITIVLLVMVALPLATPLVAWVVKRMKKDKGDKTSIWGKEAMASQGQMDQEGKGIEAPLMRSHADMGAQFVYEEEQGPLESGEGFTSSDLGHPQFEGGSRAGSFTGSVGASELEDEKPPEADLLPEPERKKLISEIRKRILFAAAEGAVRVKRKKGPRRGEDFTLGQALVKADFWLLFCVLWCGAGTGMAAIDNMGQISQSQGYSNANVFVSMTSIFNFSGRLIGGYFSEILARKYALPRSWSLGVAQGIMAAGHFLIAMAWPGTLYAGTLLVGTGYGAHWGIVPPIISELFGMKSFGMLYNFYTMATPAGALFFSGFLAGYLYDLEAAKQQLLGSRPLLVGSPSAHWSALDGTWPQTLSLVASFTTSTSTSCYGAICFRSTFLVMMGVCIFGIFICTILSIRTQSVYKTLYGSIFAPPSPR